MVRRIWYTVRFTSITGVFEQLPYRPRRSLLVKSAGRGGLSLLLSSLRLRLSLLLLLRIQPGRTWLPIRPQLSQLAVSLLQRLELRLLLLLHAFGQPVGERFQMAGIGRFLPLLVGVGHADEEHDV